MRYIDTGSRDQAKALGTWLQSVLDDSVVALRLQTGFFGSNSLGLFVDTMARLSQINGILRVLVGSNDGTTQRGDVESLMKLAGPPRNNQRIGIVSFEEGFFHPKTVHILRNDLSAAAYVGSANLTKSGVSSLHVEAGILLDTREEDNPDVLVEIEEAIDWWFSKSRKGLYLVNSVADLDVLVRNNILNVPRPKKPRRPGSRRPISPSTAPWKGGNPRGRPEG